MRRWRLLPQAAGLAVLAVAVQSCEREPATTPSFDRPMFHVGCPSGVRFTGGGRVDPEGVGKTTFGFNVDGSDFCAGGELRGHIQVVHHPTQTLMHSISVTHFSSFPSPDGGVCGEFDGTARVKHVFAGGDWHEHHYFAEVCDNGEPGRGVDTFGWFIDGAGDGQHVNILRERLTGGNIQAHKN